MKEVSLKIIADAGDYLKQVNQINSTTQEMGNTVKDNYTEQAEAIKNTTDQITRLQAKQQGYIDQQIERRKHLLRLMRESRDVEDIKIYSKGVDDATKKIKEYEKSGVDAAEATKKLNKQQGISANLFKAVTRTMIRMAIRGGVTSLVIGTLTKIITSSQRAIDFFKEKAAQATAIIGQFGKAISSGNFKDFAKNLLDAARGAKELYQNQKYLLALQNQMLVVNAALSSEAVDYKNAMDDESASMEDRIENAQKYF